MAAVDAFNLPPARWSALEERFETALNKAEGKDDESVILLAELLSGLKPKEREALALSVMVGRVSVAGVAGGLVR